MPQMEVLGYRKQALSRMLSYYLGNSVCYVQGQSTPTTLWSLLLHIRTVRTDRAHTSEWWWAVRLSVRDIYAVRIRYSSLLIIRSFRVREPTTGLTLAQILPTLSMMQYVFSFSRSRLQR